MLMIKNLADLKKYLETRREMARGQERTPIKKDGHIALGVIYGFEESIKAVYALMAYQTDCPQCGGVGEVTRVCNDGDGYVDQFMDQCPECNGKGFLTNRGDEKMNCDVCGDPIDDQQNNYQSHEAGVVCESCCRRLIDKAKQSRAEKKTDVVKVEDLYREIGGGD